MRRFSKLKKRIESLFSPDLDLKIHCTVYERKGCYGWMELPRFWITLDKEIIFDWLKDFKGMRIPNPAYPTGCPVYYMDILFVTEMLQEYIETPTDRLFGHVLYRDYYGLSDILKAADRRIGVKRLKILRGRTESEAARKIIDVRLSARIKSANESTELCSGVFWVISDSSDLKDYNLLAFEIPCDAYGNVIEVPEIALNAKSGNTYNHKKLWENEIENNPAHKPYNRKPYNYYPRGRVDISNNWATIYLNPNIDRADVISEIRRRLGLSAQNIPKVRVVADNSEHYQCFIDWK
ncbi:MAG: hypothetical protein FWD71_21315 [Oscillospiraceae bacterium]|nr:hypothetical protein [Oscillospiraceae bacterium]